VGGVAIHKLVMFDDVLEVFGDLVWQRENVKAALNIVNSDAVWLSLQDLGKNKRLDIPTMEGFTFTKIDTSLSA
jgi:hypothetical protein